MSGWNVDPSIVGRQINLAERITNGLKDGSLTVGEGSKLATRLVELESKRASAMEGGLSQEERKDLRSAQLNLSVDVFRNRHDAQGVQHKAPTIAERADNQETRLQKGAVDGSLSGDEVSRIDRRLDRIDNMTARLTNDADGFTAKDERQVLRAQFQASSLIYNLRHNDVKNDAQG
jgi:hypothetical protein